MAEGLGLLTRGATACSVDLNARLSDRVGIADLLHDFDAGPVTRDGWIQPDPLC